MIVPDANLLLYSYDTAGPFHEKARLWWERCLSGNDEIGLTHPALFAFIRISTNSRVFEHPMTVDESVGHVNAWCERAVARILEPDPDHIRLVAELLLAAGSAGGNLVTDAQIAAIAKAHRAIVHTADHDFQRFPDLAVYYPLDAKE